MERINISTNSKFENEIGYSRAVKVGNMVFVSGCTGYNYTTHVISADIVEQTEQTFLNIIHALEQAGASLNNVVRVQYILPNASLFEKTWPTLQKYFGTIRPAATMLSAGLANNDMLIEIEVTAVIN
jgi:enamine deaminase RidA (YjgF/YER057c/UK114 family)